MILRRGSASLAASMLAGFTFVVVEVDVTMAMHYGMMNTIVNDDQILAAKIY